MHGRRNRCNTKRLNAAGKWIGGRGRTLRWWGIGNGTYLRGGLHRAIRRSIRDYTRYFINTDVEDAIEYADSDAHENDKAIAMESREVNWRGS